METLLLSLKYTQDKLQRKILLFWSSNLSSQIDDRVFHDVTFGIDVVDDCDVINVIDDSDVIVLRAKKSSTSTGSILESISPTFLTSSLCANFL